MNKSFTNETFLMTYPEQTDTPVLVVSLQNSNKYEYLDVVGSISVSTASFSFTTADDRYYTFSGHITMANIDDNDEIDFYINLQRMNIPFRADTVYATFSIHDNISGDDASGLMMEEEVINGGFTLCLHFKKNKIGSNGESYEFSVNGSGFIL